MKWLTAQGIVFLGINKLSQNPEKESTHFFDLVD